jgi:hypothetical protein
VSVWSVSKESFPNDEPASYGGQIPEALMSQQGVQLISLVQ